MKTINVTFTDDEYDELKSIKKEQSWHDFILEVARESEFIKKNPDGDVLLGKTHTSKIAEET
jgi:predicted CopG family antitoxin